MIYQVKKFGTVMYKEIIIKKNPKTNLFDLRVAFHKSNTVTLFEGSAKIYQINHLSHETSIPIIVFYAEIDPEITKIIIKGQFQIRTFVENDRIQKYVIERYGAKYNHSKVVTVEIE